MSKFCKYKHRDCSCMDFFVMVNTLKKELNSRQFKFSKVTVLLLKSTIKIIPNTEEYCKWIDNKQMTKFKCQSLITNEFK